MRQLDKLPPLASLADLDAAQRLEVVEHVLESMQVGVILIDAETHVIQEINRYACNVIGLGKNDVVGSTCFTFICPASEGQCPITDLGQSMEVSCRTMLTGQGEEVPVLKSVVEVELQGRRVLLDTFISLAEPSHAESALQHNSARYRAIVEDQTELVCCFSPDLKLTYVNDAYSRFFKMRSADLLHTVFLRDLYPEGKRQLNSCLRTLSTEKSSRRLDVHVFTPKGEPRWLQWTFRVILDEQGQLLEYLAVGRDITEAVLSKRKVEHLNAVLRAIRSVNRLIVKETDTSKLLHGICEKLVQTRGYHNAWIALVNEKGEFVEAAQAGLDAQICREAGFFTPGQGPACLKQCLDTEGLRVVEDPPSQCASCALSRGYSGRSALAARLEFEDRVFGALTVSAPKFYAYDAEEHSLFQELAMDVAFALHNLEQRRQRERTQEQLIYSRDFNQTVAGLSRVIIESDSLHDIGHLMMGTAMQLTRSDFAAALFTAPDSGAQGSIALRKDQSLGNVPHDREQASILEIMQPAVDEAQHSRQPLILEQSRHVLMAAPCLDGEGRLLGVLALARPQEEPFLRQQLNTLIRLANLFGIAIGRLNMENALRRAKVAAEAASEAKTQFLANMSHELRTPLNGILGMVHLALEEELSPQQQEFWNVTLNSAKNLLQIVNNLLEVANLESGNVVFTERSFTPRELVESLVTAYSLQARAKGLALVHNIDPAVPEACVGDVFRIRQVLNNLMHNAVRHTSQGHVRLSMQTRGADDDDPKSLVFSVEDTGPGIAPDRQGNVFEAFNLTEHYLTKRHSGSGLGLSICKRLVELMGGSIWLQSAPDKGSEFSFSLPLRLPRHLDVASPEQFQRPLTLLVVEDDLLNRRLVCRLVERAGHSHEAAEDGLKALELLSLKPFDLVLLDVDLPGMDGLELARRIRMGQIVGVRPDLPILALTGYSLQSERNKILDAGINQLLSKPFEEKQLQKAIMELMLQGAARDGGEDVRQ